MWAIVDRVWTWRSYPHDLSLWIAAHLTDATMYSSLNKVDIPVGASNGNHGSTHRKAITIDRVDLGKPCFSGKEVTD
jgi:hypothetical protein